MQEFTPKNRISPVTASLLIGTAVGVDFLQALLGLIYLGWLVGIAAGLLFLLWYLFLGVSFWEKRMVGKAIAGVGVALLEVIPWGWMSVFIFGWTAYTVIVVAMIKWEDKRENEKSEKEFNELLRARMRRTRFARRMILERLARRRALEETDGALASTQ